MSEWLHWKLKADGDEEAHYRDVVITLRRLETGRVRLEVRSAREDYRRPCIGPVALDFTGAEQARKFARDVIRPSQILDGMGTVS